MYCHIIIIYSLFIYYRDGYDGKNQIKIIEDNNLEQIWKNITSNSMILEKFIDFKKEISVIIARDTYGAIEYFPITENIHQNNILKKSVFPPNLDEKILSLAYKVN